MKTEAGPASETSSFIKKLYNSQSAIKEDYISESYAIVRALQTCMNLQVPQNARNLPSRGATAVLRTDSYSVEFVIN
jgi:hypothetical protein